MKNKYVCSVQLLSVALLIGACGGPGGGPGSGPGGSDDSQQQEDQGRFYYNKITLTGQRIPVSKLPKTLTDGLMDVCQEGAMQHLDKCWSEMHMSDLDIAIELKGAGKSSIVGPEVDDAWYGSLESTAPGLYKDHHSFTCPESNDQWCWSSTFYGGSPLYVNEDRQIREITVHTYYFWGRVDEFNTPYIHQWFMGGSIEMNGKTYSLPITVGNVKEAYGVDGEDFPIKVNTSFGKMIFKPLDETFSALVKNLKVPKNYDDRPIVDITLRRQ